MEICYTKDMKKTVKLNQKDLNKRRMVMLIQIAIALPLFLFGVSEAMRSADWVSYFHEFGHVFGAYTSGGSGEIVNSHLAQSYGGVRWWIVIWGPIGGSLFPVLLGAILMKFRQYAIAGLLYGAGHGATYFSLDHNPEVIFSGLALVFFIFMVFATLLIGWYAAYRITVKNWSGVLTPKKPGYSINVDWTTGRVEWQRRRKPQSGINRLTA